jgi:hypothetical protein
MKAHGIHTPANPGPTIPCRRKYDEDDEGSATPPSSSKPPRAKRQKRTKKPAKFIHDEDQERDDDEDDLPAPVKKEKHAAVPSESGAIKDEPRDLHPLAGKPLYQNGEYPWLRFPKDYPVQKPEAVVPSSPSLGPNDSISSGFPSDPASEDISNSPAKGSGIQSNSDPVSEEANEDDVFREFVIDQIESDFDHEVSTAIGVARDKTPPTRVYCAGKAVVIVD